MRSLRRWPRATVTVVALASTIAIVGLALASRAPAAMVRSVLPADDLAELRDELAPAPGALGVPTPIEDPSGRALDAVHAALRRAERGEGQARLLFYGGSHTAGDHYTGRMREALQSYFGDAGHGFVNLVPVVDAQWRWGLRIDTAEGWEVRQVGFKAREVARYGLAGVGFDSDEPGAFAAIESDSWGNGRQASRIELLYDQRPGGGSFEVWLDGARVETLSTDAPQPTGARRVYRVSDATHRIEIRVVGGGPVTVYGVVFERDVPGVLVDNLGLVGSKARHHLLWDEALWRRFFVTRRPDLVALAYGNNETDDRHLTIAQHEAHLRELMTLLRDAAPEASCLLIGPTDRLRPDAGGALEASAIVRELTAMQRRVALDFGCGFFDTLAFMGGLGASHAWHAHDPPYMRDDLQHLSHEGYVRWGEELTRALLEGYDARGGPATSAR